jgi:hypothetical protein
MAIRIQVRRGTATQWSTADPILAAGEIGFETNTGKFKIGVGSPTTWSGLDYFLDSSEISSLISGAALDNTDDLSEGTTNRYFTTDRVATALNSGSLQNISFTYNAGAQTIDVSVPTVQGTTGAQGTQGVQGVQGIQGTQGVQGVQGVQGTVGAQGTVGSQGVEGTQGTQGVQGTLGAQGSTGAFGGETFEYNYLTNTADSDPGSGNVKFNNAAFASATAIYIDPLDVNAVNITSYLQTVDDSTSSIKGTIKVTDVTDPLNYAFFQIIGTHDENSGNYFDVPIAYVSGPLTLSNNNNVTMTFARVGDKGDTGIQGTQGTLGSQGVQGPIGVGTQGTQGTDGTQGTVGTQGTTGTLPTITFSAKSAAYQLAAGDVNTWVTMNGAFNFTVPASTFTTGQIIYVQRIGAGAVSIVASGVTFTSNGSASPVLRAQYSAASIICTGTNTFTIVGDIS